MPNSFWRTTVVVDALIAVTDVDHSWSPEDKSRYRLPIGMLEVENTPPSRPFARRVDGDDG